MIINYVSTSVYELKGELQTLILVDKSITFQFTQQVPDKFLSLEIQMSFINSDVVKLLGAHEIYYIWECEQLHYFHFDKRLLPELGACVFYSCSPFG